jgi:hypothetical protein
MDTGSSPVSHPALGARAGATLVALALVALTVLAVLAAALVVLPPDAADPLLGPFRWSRVGLA